MKKVLQKIQNASLREQKTITQQHVKLSEETGELATEILIAEEAAGCTHKEKGKDGISGEAVDVVLVSLSIYFTNENNKGVTPEEALIGLEDWVNRKLSKWESVQPSV